PPERAARKPYRQMTRSVGAPAPFLADFQEDTLASLVVWTRGKALESFSLLRAAVGDSLQTP
ncbi:MAG: hypothetical protein J2P37_28075, partial [Ktedonobacteraceae bacterium]|nr:hypothetical protein [Ktedonobacteraceae bacterium]